MQQYKDNFFYTQYTRATFGKIIPAQTKGVLNTESDHKTHNNKQKQSKSMLIIN